MNEKLIRRMINLGYSNESIIDRIRCTDEAIEALRELMKLESKRNNDHEEDWDYE